jgi:hypothetical protein
MSMRASRPQAPGADRPDASFYVYVEGPRDRDVIEAWARRAAPGLARVLAPAWVILGGRQPARAAQHLARERTLEPEARGLCVLDADVAPGPAPEAAEGLAYFTWRRRHIESYLLVPAAIERAARVRDTRLRRLLEDALPGPGDERAFARFDAKGFLGRKGPLARLLGRTLAAGGIARAMRLEELHPEVHALLDALAAGIGAAARAEVSVYVRPAPERLAGEV